MDATGFRLEVDRAALRDLTDFCHSRLPKFTERVLRSAYSRTGTQLVKEVRRAGYGRKGASSVGKGPGGKYGHIAEHLYRKSGAKNFGAYIRIKFRPEGWFKAYWHERGSFKTGERFTKRGSGRVSRGWGQSTLVQKPHSTGVLPERQPLAASFRQISPERIRAITSEAIGRAIAQARRR